MPTEEQRIRDSYEGVDEEVAHIKALFNSEEQRTRDSYEGVDEEVARVASRLNPEEVAAKLKTSEAVGLPPRMITPKFQEDFEATRLRKSYEEIAKLAPKTGAWAAGNAYRTALLKGANDASEKLERSFLEKAGDIATGAWVAAGSFLPLTAAGLIGVERMFAELFIDPWAQAAQRALGLSSYSFGEQLKPAQQAYAKQAEELAGVATEQLVSGGVPEGIAQGVTSGFQIIGQVAQAIAAPPTALPTMTATVTGNAYGQARDKRVDPLRAAYFALLQGAIEYSTEKFAMGDFLEKVTSKSPLLKAAKEMVVKDIFGEQGAAFAQDLNEAAVLTPEKPLNEFWKERPNVALQTLVATIVGGGGAITISAAADKMQRVVDRAVAARLENIQKKAPAAASAVRAEAVFDRLKAAVEAANEHPLRQRHEGLFKEYIENILDGSDMADVYVNAKELTDILAQQHPDVVNKLANQVPDLMERIREAAASDTSVRISTAELLTHITEPSLQQAILPILKADPDGMTYNESQAYFQEEVKANEVLAQKEAEKVDPLLTREEFDAQQEAVATPADVQTRAEERIAELGAVPVEEVTPEQLQERTFLEENRNNPEALAQHFGVKVAEKISYEKYLKGRSDKAAARALDVEQLRDKVVTEMQAMQAFAPAAVRAMAAPIVSFYQFKSAEMGLLPSELMRDVPIRFLAKELGKPGARTDIANEDTLKRENIHTLTSKKDWAVITATNPNAKVLSAEENAARNEALRADLDALGVKYVESFGKYGDEKEEYPGFVVLGISEEDAIALGKKHGQESVLTPSGLVFSEGGIIPHLGYTIPFDEVQEINYTRIPSTGAVFNIPLRKRMLREAEDPADSLFVHPDDLAGDGRDFTAFFEAAASGKRQPDKGVPYKPALLLEGLQDFEALYNGFRANFDEHIAHSIPAFREVQIAVGAAIAKTYGEKGADVLDIGASEGSFIKAISAATKGAVRTVGVDPNVEMERNFNRQKVEGSEYSLTALGAHAQEGQTAWIEDDGTEIKYFAPTKLFDVVHEAMVFQFISDARYAQFRRVKELLKPGGVALFEEKIKEDSEAYRQAEAKKNAYKAQFFKEETLTAKEREVLNKAEQGAIGMNDLMVPSYALEAELRKNFAYVVQYWDSGNFKGYAASDDKAAVDALVGHMHDTNTEYSTVHTPRVVADAPNASRAYAQRASEAEVEEATLRRVREELDALVAFYLEANTDNGTVTIDVDAARELFPEYAESKEARTRYSGATHKAASAVAKAAYKKALSRPVAKGKAPLVAFLAGGGGSGKSTARMLNKAAYNAADVVVDGALSNYDSAVSRIEDALASGRDVVVDFVLRDPVDAFVQGVLPRAERQGRIVPLAVHAKAHVNAADVVRKLAAKYEGNARVTVRVIENLGSEGSVKAGSIDSLAKVNYNGLEARLLQALEKEKEDGKISQEIYQATKAEPEGAGSDTPHRSGAAENQLQNERPYSVTVVGHHFSLKRRAVLDGSYYGTNRAGAERQRLAGARDSRIRNRLNFYIDEGQGVFPEAGVGREDHVVELNNLYNARGNPAGFPTEDSNAFESAVLDAGYSGYYVREGFGRQGVAVLLGNASRGVNPTNKVYGQAAPVAGDVPQPAFYSKLLREVAKHPQKRGTPQQWIDVINVMAKKGIVKPEEVEYTGILDWLEAQKEGKPYAEIFNAKGDMVAVIYRGDPPVPEGGHVVIRDTSKELSREMVVAVIEENRVVINPVIREGKDGDLDISIGDWEVDEPDEYFIRENAEARYDMDPEQADMDYRRANGIDDEEEVGKEDVLEYLYNEELNFYYEDAGAPASASADVTLPDGTEVRLTLSSFGGMYSIYDHSTGRTQDVGGYPDEDVVEEYLRERYEDSFSADAGAKWSKYSLHGVGGDYQERLLINDSYEGDPFEYDTHFDEQNITAFTRVSSRYVSLSDLQETHPELAARLRAEGKSEAKVLFAEEIQSDWAQQGRDKHTITERRPYTRDMLMLDEEYEAKLAEAKAEALDNIYHYPRDGAPDGVSAIIPLPGGVPVIANNEAELRDKIAKYGVYKILAANGQVFTESRGEFPTPEDAMQYIAATRSYVQEAEALTSFELAERKRQLLKEIDELRKQRREVEAKFDNEVKVIMASPEWKAIQDALQAKETAFSSLPQNSIDKAAFVTKTDSWVALAIKDLIRKAAEEGHDIIAWTTGDQQTQRWSGVLRKQVDRIEWRKSEDGKIHIQAYDGENKKADTHYGENDLAAAIGKTMGERIISDPNQSGTIEGDEIVVADLGMVKFYGDADGNDPNGNPAIVPKVVNKVIKSLGGKGKVRSLKMAEPGYGTDEERVGYQPSFEITSEMKALAMQGLPLFQGDRKIAYFDPEKMQMAMLKGANLSSVIHESAHWYLEALRILSVHPKATERMKQDFDTTLKWFGVPNREAWDKLSVDQRRPYHEQWAQSFERWTLEGRAPTAEMQPVFSRFRAWMLSVYKSLEAFLIRNPEAGKLNDEVRGVFARLIAAEDAVAEYERAKNLLAIEKPEGVSDSVFSEYINLGEQATQDAISDMSQRTLRDMKWLSNAKNKAIRKLQKEAAALRKAIREQVSKEVMSEPVNQARTFLRTGQTTDPQTGELVQALAGYKLDIGKVAAMYPQRMTNRPDLTKLRGMTGKDGLDPEIVAQVFGFPSGDALIRSLIEEEKAEDKIAGITDQRMLEEHGELIDPVSVERAAEAAVHNDARARFMATGLKMLTNSPISAKQLVSAAKVAAMNVISRKKVRDLRPKQYTAAESRASKQVLELAAKDPQAAAAAQRNALLNNQLAKAAMEAQEEVAKALRLVERMNSESARKSIDIEYLEQIQDLLKSFDFRKGVTLKAIDKRRSFEQFVKRQEELGFEPIIDPAQLEALSRKSYKEMTVEELRSVVEAVKHIEHLGRLKKKLLTAKDAREFQERIAEAVASIEANANRKVVEHAAPSDIVGQLVALGRMFLAEHRKGASIIREMDGGKDGGVMWELFTRPMNEAGDNETSMRAEAAKAIADLFAPIESRLGGLRQKVRAVRTVVPGTKLSMTYEQRIMFALNWGNEGNRQRLLDGGLAGNRALTEEDAQRVLDTLDKRDWEFVQGVWDYLETFRPQIAEQERRLTGREPEWIDASPFNTKYGVIKGGYFPAKYDAELSTRSESLEAANVLRASMKGAFGVAATRSGYAQKRSEEVKNRPLLLSFNVIASHVNEVTHRLAWQDWVVDANRVLRALDGTIRDNYGPEILRELKKLVEDIAAGDAGATTSAERVINHLRTGSTIVGMGWRVTTALLQPSGLAQSWVRVGGKWVAKGVKQYLKNPIAASEFVNSKSKLMTDRSRTMYREINEIMNTIRAGEKVSAVQGSYFWLIAKMQRTVDIPTWLGAYEKAAFDLKLEEAANEKTRADIENKMIALADQAVIDSQSGGQLKDLARVQRGSPIFKLFTNFYSYFSATYNLNVEAYRRTNFKKPAEVGAFAADIIILNLVPVLFAVALKELLKGGCDDDDLECLLAKVAKEEASFLFGQMVLLREAGAAVGAVTGDNFGYSGPAGLRFFSDLYKAGQQAGQGEADMAAFKAFNSVGGAIFHYPAGQINSTIEGIMAIENGDANQGLLPALVSGKPRKE